MTGPSSQPDDRRSRTPGARPSRRLHGWLHGTTGGFFIVGAALVHAHPDAAVHWRLLEQPLWAVGLIVLLLALLRSHPAIERLSTGFCVSLLTFLVGVGIVEAAGRLTGFDFHRVNAARGRLPICYQLPYVRTGPVFLRRPGPAEWTGQVIRTWLRVLQLPDDDYKQEPVVTARYDRFGFRNEGIGAAWDVAVAGDSFVESGYLPYSELFTTRLGQLTGWRVLNLGVSGTGPLSYLSYLENYGLSPATRQTVIVFYEGNDIWDLDREYRALRQYQATGRYEPAQLVRQTSLLAAIGEWLGRSAPRIRPPLLELEAYWRGPDGDIGVTVGDTPPSSSRLTVENREALALFFKQYAEFARKHQVRAWLAYMPSKTRVLFSQLRFTAKASGDLRAWTPTDLPAFIARLCAQHGIDFVDLTPSLEADMRQSRQLGFNTFFDTHLNARGSEVVGEALARALGGPVATNGPAPVHGQ